MTFDINTIHTVMMSAYKWTTTHTYQLAYRKGWLYMNKFFVYSLFLLFIICCSLYIFKLNATPAITYFPPAEEFNFDEASTNLTLHEEGKEIIWTSNSKSNDTLYLRQDISLLYMNGIFKGVQSKWERQVDKIHLKKMFPYKNKGYMQ